MNEVYAKLNKCYEQYQKICKMREIDFVPEIALVLGSGLGDYADDIQVVAEIDYHEMEGFPVSTVAGHQGKYILGYVNEVPVVCMKGRVHYYEGYPISDVVLPIRLMKLMGAQVLFLTNASGGINTCFKAGDFMMIKDQISSFVPSPLIGPNAEELGVRFPDIAENGSVKGYSVARRGIYTINGTKLRISGRSSYVQDTWSRCSGDEYGM